MDFVNDFEKIICEVSVYLESLSIKLNMKLLIEEYHISLEVCQPE